MADLSFEYNVPVFAGTPEEGTEPTHRVHRCTSDSTGKQQSEASNWPNNCFDAASVPDYLLLGCDNTEYEYWTLLSAMAGFTTEMNLGSLVLCNDYRNPALVAKMVATLDIISDGRLKL